MIPIGTTTKRYISFIKETHIDGDHPALVETHDHEVELTPQPFDVHDEQARDLAASTLADIDVNDLESAKPHLQWIINPETKDAALVIYRTNVLGPNASDPSYEVEDEEDSEDLPEV